MNDTLKADLQAVFDKNKDVFVAPASVTVGVPVVPTPPSTETVEFNPQ